MYCYDLIEQAVNRAYCFDFKMYFDVKFWANKTSSAALSVLICSVLLEEFANVYFGWVGNIYQPIDMQGINCCVSYIYRVHFNLSTAFQIAKFSMVELHLLIVQIESLLLKTISFFYRGRRNLLFSSSIFFRITGFLKGEQTGLKQ